MPQPMRQPTFAEFADGDRSAATLEFGRLPASIDNPALVLERQLHARYVQATVTDAERSQTLGQHMMIVAAMAAGLWALLGAGAWLALG